VNYEVTDDSGWGQIMEDISFSLRTIPQWEMRYSRRETNKIVHVLANLAISDEMEMVWLYCPSDCTRDLLQADSFALQISQ
jgi:hypothetical protein